jgi:hypothetical protein
MHPAKFVVADVIILGQEIVRSRRDYVPPDVHRVIRYQIERIAINDRLVYTAVDLDTDAACIATAAAVASA